MNPSYSICVTNYNNVLTLRQSVESILNQIDSRFEIVVVDNKSTDGSQLVLREYSNRGKLKLVRARCSRGKGRQIAFENSIGNYVISNLDFDDVFQPRLDELLNKYHATCKETLLWVKSVDKRGFW